MHIALHCRHQNLAGGFALATARQSLRLHVRHEHGDGALHHARRLDHLRQEHLARAEQIANDIHSRHQRPLDDVKRSNRRETRLLDILIDEVGHAIDEGVFETLGDGFVAPCEVLFL